MRRNHFFRYRQSCVLVLVVCHAFSSPAFAAPAGAVVANGQVSITQPAAGMTQIRASSGAIINWKSFSIGAGETTRFLQPSATSAVLNRVVGQEASRILGQLQANGRVFLINPNGIVIGAGARIDTNGFIASTLNIADADFLAGKLKFYASGTAGNISNQGLISVGPGGQIALIAPNIENTGIIQAPGGQILLAAGRKIEISSLDHQGVSFEVQAPSDTVLNLGKLLADNGTVQVFAGTLRHGGEIRANRLVQDGDGSIRLVGTNDVTLSSDSATRADGLSGGSITIQSPAGTTRVAGDISARGAEGAGGYIHLLGDRVAVEAGTRVDASGASGGGEILVGGDYQGRNSAIQNASRVFVSENASLLADATEKGDGGRIIVWADENTRYFGSLSARGGVLGGNGGFAEVSGKQNLEFSGSANLTASRGNNGTLLLDPLDILVSANGGRLPIVTDQFADFQSNVVTISPTGLNLIGGNVVLEADRHIYFNTPTVFTGSSLTVSAAKATGGGTIYLNQNLSTGGGSVDLSGSTVTGTGGISTAGGGINIHVTGGLSYTSPIVSGGGAVSLSTSSGSISSANINAGGGTVSLSTPAGSLSNNTITGGLVSLTSSSWQNNTVAASNRINATSSGSSVQLNNVAGQTLRLGTINGASRVSLYSSAGMQQVSGGLITAPEVHLYGQNSASALGAPGASLNVASPRLRLQSLAAPAYVAFSGSPTVNELYLQGSLAALSGTSITGSGNLSTFSMTNGGTELNVNAVAASGFANGLTFSVSDAGINAPTLNIPGPLTLDVRGPATLGTINSQSLSVTADRSISVTSATTSSGDLNLNSGTCYYNSTCAFTSSITAGSLTTGGAGSIGVYARDNGDIDIGTMSAGGSATVYASYNSNSQFATRTSAVNLGAVTAGSSVNLRNYGTGAITLTGALNAGSSVYLNAYKGALSLQTVASGNSGINGNASGDITFQSLTANGASGSVSLASSGGGIRTTVDNVASDIVAATNVTLTANNTTSGLIGDLSFANPMDIKAGTNNAVTLSSGTSVGAVGKPVTVDTNGSIAVAASAGQFHVIAQDTTGTQKTVSGIDLSASAAGMGVGGTSTFTSQNLIVNAVSDGSNITIGDVVQTDVAKTFDKFRFAASGTSGLTFGNVDLATGGQDGHAGYAAYNQFLLVSGGAMTQTTPGVNNINAGYINLTAGSGAVTVGNVTSSVADGNSIYISGGAITAGNLTAPSIDVRGTGLSLGTVASSGTHNGSWAYVPRLGYNQYLTDLTNLSASTSGITTTGNISSATYATVSASNGTLSTGNVTASGGNLTVSATNFTTGNLSASGNLYLTATGAYQPGAAIALSSGGAGTSTTITAPGGIDLTTNNATLTTPTAYLRASGGGIKAALTGTGYLDMIAGGPLTVSSSIALTNLYLQAKGNLFGGASSITGTGQTFGFVTGGTTASLALASATALQARYTELSPAASVANIDVAANFGATGNSLQISGNGATINANSVASNGSATFSTVGNVNLTSVNTSGGNLSATSSAGNVTLTSVSTGGGTVGVSAATDVNVESVTTLGNNVSLTATNGNIVKVGAQPLQINTIDGFGAPSGTVTLSASNGSVGSAASHLQIGNALTLTTTAKNEIAVDVTNPLTNLYLTTNASGSGILSVTNSNFGGFSLTRSGSDLLLGTVAPGSAGSFSLTARDGNIKVSNDISNVANLTLNAGNGYNSTGDLIIQAGGGARSVTASGVADLRAGRDVIISAGSADGESVSVQTGAATVYAGRDIKILGSAGTGSSAALTTGGSLGMGNVSGGVTIQGGSGANAFAEINTNGSQTIGSQNSWSVNPTDFILVQGGANTGSYASVRATGNQNLYTIGDVSVLGGSGAGANAEIYSSVGNQTIGSTYGYYTPATQNILVQAGSGGTARILAAGSQNIQGNGNISVIGGAGANMTASIESTGSTQTIGYARNTSNYFPTDNVVVQAGSASGAAAWIKAASGQTIDAGQTITLTGGPAGAYAEISTAAGMQTVGNRNGSYDQTDSISLVGGSGAGGYARMSSGGNQTLNTIGAITVANAGSDAASIIASGTQTITAASLAVSLGSLVTSAVSEVRTSGNQTINLDGGGGTASLSITNSSSVTDSLAQVRADGNQVVSMPYSMAAGTLQIGSSTSQGPSLLRAGGTQNLLVGDVLVQGGTTTASSAKILSIGNSDISAINGSVQVLGGAAGSAAIDPPFLNLVTNGSIVVQGGGAPTATATITAGNLNLGATNGNVLVTGGSAGGAAATLLANGIPGTLNLFASGNLALTPNAGGASASAAATSGNNINLGGSCIGCATGLLGTFTVSTNLLPSAVNNSLVWIDPISGDILSMMDSLQSYFDFLTLTEEGELVLDPSRRRLPQCY